MGWVWTSWVCGLGLGVVWMAGPVMAAEPGGRGGGDAAGGPATGLRLYVGTYTTPKNASKGIYRLDMDPRTGRLGEPVVAGEARSPSFLAIDRRERFLYAVGELSTFEGQQSGAVSAFAIDPASGRLTLLNQQASGGVGPCYVSLDAGGRYALVANYGSGSVSALPIEADGRLGKATAVVQHEGAGPDPKRQTGPHAHSIRCDPAGRLVFAPDLGIDRVMIYRLGGDGTLRPGSPPGATLDPGSGPRHLDFHPGGRFIYVINELGCSVTVFAYDAERGAMRPVQTISTLPGGFSGLNTCADIHVHPSGRFLYGSNRGHDSIAIFAIDGETGKLTAVGHQSTQGKTPRNFNIDPSGTWLIAANQASDSLVVFRIDGQTGLLRPADSTATVPSPVCVQFVSR